MSRSSLFVLALIQFLAMLGAARADAAQLTLIHPGQPGSLYEISANEFAGRLSKRLPENYQVSVTTNSGIGDGLALLDSVKNGRATFALASSGLVSLSNSFAIFELPFLIRTRDQIPAIREKLLAPYLQPEAERHGLHILGVWENGFRHFTNDQWPVRHMRDMKGLKIAVPPANSWRQNMMRAFGATPVPMSPRAFASALDATVVNGQEAPLLQIASLNPPEMRHHLSLSDHLYSPAFLVTASANFSRLEPEIQEIIADEAEAMESWIQELAIRVESELVDRLDQSMQMTHISRNAFLAASRPLYAEFASKVPDGKEMISIVRTFRSASADDLSAFLPGDDPPSDQIEQGSADQ